jgi:S-adenosylmethionine-dependent methyltransferase
MWREKMTANANHERFLSGARKYAAYLETPEGRLRLDLAFANLQEALPTPQDSLRVLDLGAGTGATAIRLARLGFHVTLLDLSPEMLDMATRTAQGAGVAAKITLKQGDAANVAELLHAERFDVIVCHNLLEYVDDPGAVLRAATGLMRNSSAILSVLVRSHAGEILKTAIQSGDLKATKNLLTAQWGRESLYGGSVRLFTSGELLEMSREARLEVIARHGVRVVADYLPPQISREADYERIFELERKLGQRPEFSEVARYMQCLARRTSPAKENCA